MKEKTGIAGGTTMKKGIVILNYGLIYLAIAYSCVIIKAVALLATAV